NWRSLFEQTGNAPELPVGATIFAEGTPGEVMTPDCMIAQSRAKWGVVLSVLLLASVLSPGRLLPAAHAQLLPGDSLIIDPSAGKGGRGALFRVNPATGTRWLLSDFGDGDNRGVNPGGVAVDGNGNILVSDVDAGTDTLGALFRVDPNTGARTLLSDFG